MNLRTEEIEILSDVSEVRATSDRRNRNILGCVRSQGNFGKKKSKYPRMCPKSGQLRKEEIEILSDVSEVRATSDRRKQNTIVCVRSQGNFGQKKAKYYRMCPKSKIKKRHGILIHAFSYVIYLFIFCT